MAGNSPTPLITPPRLGAKLYVWLRSDRAWRLWLNLQRTLNRFFGAFPLP